jgi:hypothetical protein
MKQKLLIFLVLIFLVLLLAGLNAATYVQKEKVPDTEFAPNRSSYNSGSTGTQAFFSLLSETGRNVTRWQSSLETLSSQAKGRPDVFVMIGPLRRELGDDEKTKLMEWVSAGGTLVLIDREPSSDLIATTSQWSISVLPEVITDLYTIDATNPKQMTSEKVALKPLFPSVFASGVNAVQPSRFASSIKLQRSGYTAKPESGEYRITGDANEAPSSSPYDLYSNSSDPPPPLKKSEGAANSSAVPNTEEEDPKDAAELEPLEEEPAFVAPVVHLGAAGRGLLVEAPFSEGRVIILSDPFIVANNGIGMVDNSRLAINLVASIPGLIAFDEYHHGYGANNNRLFQYFEGTPVIAIFIQCALLVALVFISQSRRFARPIPEKEPSRLSKLEYVSAMAELQQRTRAYDLAIENIYSDFRRRVTSLVGLDNTTATRPEIARRIAERTRQDVREVEDLLFSCEDVIQGEPVNRKTTLSLIERLRDIEDMLGLKRSVRKGL